MILSKSNLLQFYEMNLHTLPDNQRKLNLEAYAQVIFQLPIEKVLIESLFTIMNYNKDKNRSRLNDANVASITDIKISLLIFMNVSPKTIFHLILIVSLCTNSCGNPVYGCYIITHFHSNMHQFLHNIL